MLRSGDAVISPRGNRWTVMFCFDPDELSARRLPTLADGDVPAWWEAKAMRNYLHLAHRSATAQPYERDKLGLVALARLNSLDEDGDLSMSELIVTAQPVEKVVRWVHLTPPVFRVGMPLTYAGDPVTIKKLLPSLAVLEFTYPNAVERFVVVQRWLLTMLTEHPNGYADDTVPALEAQV